MLYLCHLQRWIKPTEKKTPKHRGNIELSYGVNLRKHIISTTLTRLVQFWSTVRDTKQSFNILCVKLEPE